MTEANKRMNEKIEEITRNHGVSMATITIAWSLSKPFITAPILGISKKEWVDEAAKAIYFKLSDEEIESIDELYAPNPVVSHM